MTTAAELRQMYLDYFEKQHNHTLVASSPIVPPDDPTMLFTSAGMVQFKALYAGDIDPLPYTRAVSCQKCLRAGGKGSDLENVGRTSRHHTFFEMLGNFSFGDYFKREALEWGWDFILDQMKLPPERLWATIYEDDDEAEALLVEVLAARGIENPLQRIIRLDAKENFWGPAGETGACGPCSEICFFMGSDEELAQAATQDKATIARRIVEEGDTFLEIWNMVFPQFDQQPDGSRKPLKNRGIDTGAGLERMTTAMQFMESSGKVRSPYETDLLQPIVQEAARLVGKGYVTIANTKTEEEEQNRFRINAIVDHVRTLTFAISEGMLPSNEGRGYVLRRILRRALRYGYLLGMEEPFMFQLVEQVVSCMGEAYPQLQKNPEHAAKVIQGEETLFLRTVANGTRILDKKIHEARQRPDAIFSGANAFELYATYGFPVDLTAEIVEDAELTLDRAGYEAAMLEHQETARQSWKGSGGGNEAALLDDILEAHGETEFVGYDSAECESKVLAIIKDGQRVDAATAEDHVLIVYDKTPFYAESGGQIGDNGSNTAANLSMSVSDVQKTPGSLFIHKTIVDQGTIKVGHTVFSQVDPQQHLDTMRNHSVTHLMQAALKQVVGEHVTQAGSWVGPEGLRFDFQHMQACTSEELAEVERRVNEMILADYAITTEVLPIDEARKQGAIAPFGEKYGHVVRVVKMGDVSMEFCGGTHLTRTSLIGSFRLVSESSVASGVRRIEAVTGHGAYAQWAATRDVAAELSRALAVKEDAVVGRVSALQDEVRSLQKEIKKLKQANSAVSLDDLLAQAQEIAGLQVIVARIDDADNEQLRALADQLRDKTPDSVILLGTADAKKAMLICTVGKAHTGKIKAGDVIKRVAPLVGGGGGGRPDMAQAGGKQPEKLNDALQQAAAIITDLLGS